MIQCLTKEMEKKHCEAAINRSKWWKIVAREHQEIGAMLV